ncbi:DNA polymerase epsilon subunit 4 [Geodia barretti]|uniref:DNA polymerase epsilon subunit 4 n=1 Tax=Geodia barretti TaxID=519541 RepID=A0AA35S9N0_GEOBA|nr:DNA polymerase epsilon subunit 4 [Geodia barretti]
MYVDSFHGKVSISTVETEIDLGVQQFRNSPRPQATELFISHLARQAYEYTVQGKRKTLQRRDIDACLSSHDELTFLEGALDPPHTG